MSETRLAQVHPPPGASPQTDTLQTSVPLSAASVLASLGYHALSDLSVLTRSDVGSYVLFIPVAQRVDLTIGRLGPVSLTPGLYAYSGSALRGLRARLARHLRSEKTIHWHVDYLLAITPASAVFVHLGSERLECAAVSALLSMPGSTRPIARFGSSDCRCQGHLIAVAR
jgi:Uri superfamily endonuclease